MEIRIQTYTQINVWKIINIISKATCCKKFNLLYKQNILVNFSHLNCRNFLSQESSMGMDVSTCCGPAWIRNWWNGVKAVVWLVVLSTKRCTKRFQKRGTYFVTYICLNALFFTIKISIILSFNFMIIIDAYKSLHQNYYSTLP